MKKLITMTFLIDCILFAITPNIPTTSWLIEINDFLPNSFFVIESFPLLSKVINNYVSIASLVGVFLLYKEQYDCILINEKARIETGRFWFFLSCIIYIINYFFMYFGYLVNLKYFNNPIYTYKFHYFYDNKLGFFIWSWLSINLNAMILGIFIARLVLFFNKKLNEKNVRKERKAD